VLPAAVAAGWWWASTPSWQLDALAQQHHDTVASAQPAVVILGSSLAVRDLDRPTLARALDLPVERVVTLSVPAATAAHWYAVLSERVYGQGVVPERVVFADALASMLTVDVQGLDHQARLLGQLDRPLPVLERALPEGATRTARQRGLRDAYVGGLPSALLGGRPRVDEATTSVFGTDKLDTARRLPGDDRWVLPEHAADSLLPELLALLDTHGSEALFVRLPLSPAFPASDYVVPTLETETAELLADGGAAYLSLRALGLEDHDFDDPEHANPEGATRITEAVATALVDGTSWVPPRPEVRLDGEAVETLEPRRFREVTVSLPGAWPEGSSLDVRLRARGPGTVTLGNDTATGDGRLAVSQTVAATAPLTLTVTGDAVLDSLTVGTPTQTVWVWGAPHQADVPTVRLVGGYREDLGVRYAFSDLPPARPLRARRGTPWVAQMPMIEPMSDTPTRSDVVDGRHDGAVAGRDYLMDLCSPFRVLERGRPLRAGAFQDHLAAGHPGLSAHLGKRLLFNPTDPTAAHTFGLGADRRCRLKKRPGRTPLRDALWLYPGDTTTLTVDTDRLPFGLRSLRATGQAYGQVLEITATAGPHEVTLPLSELTAGVQRELPSPVEGPVSVTLHNPGPGFVLLTTLSVAEHAR
jgi:hypothetical protein